MVDSFGAELKRLRGDRSQQEVATAAGITQTFLSELETGRKVRLGADVLFNICRALGVQCDHFASFFPAPEPADKPMGKRK